MGPPNGGHSEIVQCHVTFDRAVTPTPTPLLLPLPLPLPLSLQVLKALKDGRAHLDPDREAEKWFGESYAQGRRI